MILDFKDPASVETATNQGAIKIRRLTKAAQKLAQRQQKMNSKIDAALLNSEYLDSN